MLVTSWHFFKVPIHNHPQISTELYNSPALLATCIVALDDEGA